MVSINFTVRSNTTVRKQMDLLIGRTGASRIAGVVLVCIVTSLCGCGKDSVSETVTKAESKKTPIEAAAKSKTTTYEVKVWPEYATVTFDAANGMKVLQDPGGAVLSQRDFSILIERGSSESLAVMKEGAIKEASHADHEVKILTDTKDTLVFDAVMSNGSYATFCYWLFRHGDKVIVVSVQTALGDHRTTDQDVLDAFATIKKSMKLKK